MVELAIVGAPKRDSESGVSRALNYLQHLLRESYFDPAKCAYNPSTIPPAVPILALGKEPLQTYLDESNIDDWHGHIHYVRGSLVCHTYDLKRIFQKPDLLPALMQELVNFNKAIKNPSVLNRPLVVNALPPDSNHFVCDLEWDIKSQRVHTVGWAVDPNTGYSIFEPEIGLNYTIEQIKAGHTIIGHNVISADLEHIDAKPLSYGPEHVFDTMVVGHLVHPHFAGGMLSLGDLTAYYFPLTQWKHDKHDMRSYNAWDCAYNYRLYQALKRDVESTGQTHLIKPKQELEHLTGLMLKKGVRINVEALRRLVEKKQEDQAAIKALLPINPNSPKQIKDWAWEKKGIRLDDTTFDTLSKHSGKDAEFDKLIEYRSDAKSISTWFDFEVDKKGAWVGGAEYMYPRFSATGTAVDRLSSSSPNYQNLPPHLRHLIIPEEGHVLVSFDGKNAEGRWVAFCAQDAQMIADFNSGLDIHQTVANRLSEAAGVTISRQFGKATVHASNYGEGPTNLARRLFGNQKRDSVEKAAALQRAYFKAYPATKAWQDSIGHQLDNGDLTLVNPYGRMRKIYALDSRDRVKRGCHFLGCSSAAYTVNKYGTDVYNEFGLVPLLIVHDELLYQIPLDQISILPRLIEFLHTPFPEMVGLSFPWGLKYGFNYGSLTEVKEPLKLDINTLKLV